MPPELASLVGQAGRAEPAIQAAALLHIARVLTVFDREEAAATLDVGLALADSLPEREKSTILEQGLSLVAAVDPPRAFRLLAEGSVLPRHLHHIFQTMVEHGHVEALAAYLIEAGAPAEYPFSIVGLTLQKCADDDTRARVLRSAIRMWLDMADVSKPRNARQDSVRTESTFFLDVFAHHRLVLSHDETAEVTRRMVDTIRQQPAEPTNARVNSRTHTVEFHQRRDYQLFHLLPLVREFAPDLIDDLFAAHPELAAAAAVFPLGMDSVQEEIRREAPAAACGSGFSYAGSGDPGEIEWAKKKWEGERVGDFEPHFEDALRRYAEDSDPQNPNHAPREFWPSTQVFRQAMYRSGKAQGARAIANLDRIPDPDLRLLAEIEFHAALAGLPECRGSWIQSRRRAGP